MDQAGLVLFIPPGVDNGPGGPGGGGPGGPGGILLGVESKALDAGIIFTFEE